MSDSNLGPSRYFRFLPLVFLGSLAACSGGGGGGASIGGLKVVGVNLGPGQVLPINVPIEITFDKPIDEDTLTPTSFQISPLPPSTAGAPVAGPVVGSYFVKPGTSGRTAVFQPACPTDPGNTNGGLLPGNVFGNVVYSVLLSLPTTSQPQVIRALDGSTLGESFSFTVQTPAPPVSPLLDSVAGPPSVTETASLPATLGLNLLIHPVGVISIVLDQAVLASSIDDDAVIVTFVDSSVTTRIPAAVTLAENCNAEGRSVLHLVFQGPLPAGETLTFKLGKTVKDFSGAQNFDDVQFHTALVANVGGAPQKDVILENFDDSSDSDTSAPIFVPFATWQGGSLQAAPIYPGAANDIEITIGPGSTNGKTAVFSTDSGFLKDINGVNIPFVNGVIEVKKFTLLDGGSSGSPTRLDANGSNPLIIRCSESFTVQANAVLSVDGQDGSKVAGTCPAQFATPGGTGRCGGGDGGRGNPVTNGSCARGEDGNGPFNTVGEGGRGGHSAYGTNIPGANPCYDAESQYNPIKAAGGGAGTWGKHWEVLDSGTGPQWGTQCYSKSSLFGDVNFCAKYFPNVCQFPLSNPPPPDTACPNLYATLGACPGDNSPLVPNNTRGEPGNNGVATSKDALTGMIPALGGEVGPDIFEDSDPSNNFFGRKPSGTSSVLTGELNTVLGGEGGGGGGNSIGKDVFPSSNYINSDKTGGGGGGGGGVVWVQALLGITVKGTISANGGKGGGGSEQGFPDTNGRAGGGGGGGAGGMIILESPSFIRLGMSASLQARGGQRGIGSGGVIASPGASCTPTSAYCGWQHCSGGRGGAGGKGVIQFGLPFDTGSTVACGIDSFDPSVCTVAGADLRPVIKSGALIVETNAAGTTSSNVSCERDCLVTTKCEPDPNALVLSFGARSAARSPWYYTGQASFVGAPTYAFAGINSGTGLVDTNYTETFASGSGGSVLSSSSVSITSSTLAALIASEPQILIGDSFQATTGGAALPITSSSLSGNTVTLTLDTTSASVSSIGSWTVLRNYFLPLVNGAASPYPSSATTATIVFQGADEDASSPGSVDSGTITATTADISTLAGKKFLRFLVNFDMNATGGALSTTAPRPGFDKIRIPYSF